MTDLVTQLPDALSWPWLLGIFFALLPKMLGKIRGLIHAYTFLKLGNAVIDKADWTKEGTVDGVLDLMKAIDRHSVQGTSADPDLTQGPIAAGPEPVVCEADRVVEVHSEIGADLPSGGTPG